MYPANASPPLMERADAILYPAPPMFSEDRIGASKEDFSVISIPRASKNSVLIFRRKGDGRSQSSLLLPRTTASRRSASDSLELLDESLWQNGQDLVEILLVDPDIFPRASPPCTVGG